MQLSELLLRAQRRRALPPTHERARIRQAVGLTQAEIAMVLGVDRTTVCRWERGNRRPGRAHVNKYAALLERLAREAVPTDAQTADSRDQDVAP
jgi:transcriptional regulator with XRE-family HTH domain